jgi:hypothetical protein
MSGPKEVSTDSKQSSLFATFATNTIKNKNNSKAQMPILKWGPKGSTWVRAVKKRFFHILNELLIEYDWQKSESGDPITELNVATSCDSEAFWMVHLVQRIQSLMGPELGSMFRLQANQNTIRLYDARLDPLRPHLQTVIEFVDAFGVDSFLYALWTGAELITGNLGHGIFSTTHIPYFTSDHLVLNSDVMTHQQDKSKPQERSEPMIITVKSPYSGTMVFRDADHSQFTFIQAFLQSTLRENLNASFAEPVTVDNRWWNGANGKQDAKNFNSRENCYVAGDIYLHIFNGRDPWVECFLDCEEVQRLIPSSFLSSPQHLSMNGCCSIFKMKQTTTGKMSIPDNRKIFENDLCVVVLDPPGSTVEHEDSKLDALCDLYETLIKANATSNSSTSTPIKPPQFSSVDSKLTVQNRKTTFSSAFTIYPKVHLDGMKFWTPASLYREPLFSVWSQISAIFKLYFGASSVVLSTSEPDSHLLLHGIAKYPQNQGPICSIPSSLHLPEPTQLPVSTESESDLTVQCRLFVQLVKLLF